MKTNHLLAVLVLAAIFPAASLHAQLYAFSRNGQVNEYGSGGGLLASGLMSGVSPLSANYVAVSGGDVFAVSQNGRVGEYHLDGSTVNATLIAGTAAQPLHPVIAGGDLYIAELSGSATVVGQYGLNGSTLNASLFSVPGTTGPDDLLESGGDLFIAERSGTIGEYALDGSTIHAALLSGFSYPSAIAISGNHLFVADYTRGTVGEYGLDGSTINPSLITGLNEPINLAIDGNDLFVGNYGNNVIGEYGLDGSPVNPALITDPGLFSLAIVPEPSPLALLGVGMPLLWLARFARRQPRK